MKRNLLYTALAAAVLFSCKPKPYEVSREIQINAPVGVVFSQVNNLKAQEAWSPWEAKDPEMTREYSGPEEGVGAKYAWSGNDEVGTGYMQNKEVTEHSAILCDLVFTEPWQSESTISWSFSENDGVTTARWTVNGEMPGFMFWMGQSKMDEMMGPDFEAGLASLKTVAEDIYASMPKWSVEEVTVASVSYYGITSDAQISEIDQAFYEERFNKIATYLGADTSKVTGPAFAINLDWNEEAGTAKMTIAMPVDSKKPGNNEINKGTTHSGQALKMMYYGSYDNMKAAYEYLYGYVFQNGYSPAGPSWEVYVVDPEAESDPVKWVTEIYVPVTRGGTAS